MAILYKADNTITDVRPKNPPEFSAQEIHDLVGGYFEIVNVTNGYMAVDEDGKAKEKLPNNNATGQYWSANPAAALARDFIVGDALLLHYGEIS